MRAGGAGEAVEVDRLAHLPRAARAFEAFKRRDLYDIQLAALFLDAVFLSVRPDGPKEGVLVRNSRPATRGYDPVRPSR